MILNWPVIGCGEYKMDDSLEGGAYIKHVTAGRLVIGCNETGDSFELTCEHGRWIGLRTNCSSSFARKSSTYNRDIRVELLVVCKYNTTYLFKVKFHYASFFGAGSELALNQSREWVTQSDP